MTATLSQALTLEEVDGRLTPAPVRFDVILPPAIPAGREEVVVSSFPETIPPRLEALSRFIFPTTETVDRPLGLPAFTGILGVDIRDPAEAVPFLDFRADGIRLELPADRPRFWVKRALSDIQQPTATETSVTLSDTAVGESVTRIAANVIAARTSAFFLPVQPMNANPTAPTSEGRAPIAVIPNVTDGTHAPVIASHALTPGRSEIANNLTEATASSEPDAVAKADAVTDVVVPALVDTVDVVARAVNEPIPLAAALLPVGMPVATALVSELQSLEIAVKSVFADLPACGAELAESLSLTEDYTWGAAVTLLVGAGAVTVRLDRTMRSNGVATGIDSLFVWREGPTRADRPPA